MSDLIGLSVGGYKIISVLGRGGMGTVFLAENPNGRTVALKIVEEAPGITIDAMNRVRVEVEAAKALKGHPNVIEVLDSGIDHGKHFIAMPWLAGWRGYRSLADLIDRGSVSQRQGLDYGVKIARALDFAHSKGLVHRDVKPSNVLLTAEGQPVVSDFGLAMIDGGKLITQTPRGLGTAYYMSPEQARGDEFLDGRADIYSLGVVLYELLTDGQMPYLRVSSTTAQVFKDILEGNIRPLRKVRKDISRDVEAVVMKCLELDRRNRYLSGEALARDLENCLAGQPVAARKVGVAGRLLRWSARRKPLATALAAVLVLALAATAGFFLFLKERGRSEPGLKLVFQDSFSRPDGKDEGPDWWDKDGSATLKDGALVLTEGWIALGKKYPGDIRMEFDAVVTVGGEGGFGAFINALEGHWNGYAAWYENKLGQGSEIMRLNSMCLADERRPVIPGRRARFALARRGNRITVEAGGRAFMKYMDLDPLSDEKYGRLGLMGDGSEVRFDEVKVYVLEIPPRISPAEAGDALWRRKDPSGALREYTKAMGALEGEDREVCGLKIGRCLSATGKDGEAYKWYKDMAGWDLSSLGRRRLAGSLMEAAAALGHWSDYLENLEAVMTDPEAGAEAQEAIRSLGNFDRVSTRRNLWEGARFGEAWASYTANPFTWSRANSPRVLARFARLLGHDDEALTLGENLLARGSGAGPASASLAEALWNLCGALSQGGKSVKARELWDSEKRRLRLGETTYYDTRNHPLHELDRLYGKDGAGLRSLFEGGIDGDRKNNAPWAYLELAMYAWGRNDEKLALALFKKLQKVYPLHGSAMGASLLNMAAIDLWKGRKSAGTKAGARIASEFPDELWAQPLARLLQGKISPSSWTKGAEKEAVWLRLAAGPRLASAAYWKAAGETGLCRSELELVRALAFPWEPSHLIAVRWLSELKKGSAS